MAKKAAANDGNELQAVCTKLPTLCTKLPAIWSDGSISATTRPTNTNEVSLESSLAAHLIHASLDVIRSLPSLLHCEKRVKVTWMVILGWMKYPPGPFTCTQARIAVYATGISAGKDGRSTPTFFSTVFNHFPLEDFLKPTGIDKLVRKEPISTKNSKSKESTNFFFCWT